MAETQSNSGPFRQKSLDRLASPERLDQLLRLVHRRSWIPLATLSVLVALAVAWAIFGRIPVTVEGKGILIHPRHVLEIESPGSGRIESLDVHVGDIVEAGQILAHVAQPDLEKHLEQQRLKVSELTALRRTAEILQSGSGPDSDDHLAHSQAVAGQLRRESVDALIRERAILEQQLGRARELSEAFSEEVEQRLELYADGVITEPEVTVIKGQYLDSLTRVSDLETRLVNLRTRELELKDQYLIRLQRIADLNLDLQASEQQVADAKREVARLELRLSEEATIISEQAGRVLEISVYPGEYVERGERWGSLAVAAKGDALASLTYFTVRDGKRIGPGDPVLVTPDTVERARYGGIVGTVLRVSPYPVTLGQAGAEIGNRELAETLISGGYRMQILARLESDPADGERLLWSSSNGADIEITPGTTTTARVTIEERAPIGWVLPILREATGVE